MTAEQIEINQKAIRKVMDRKTFSVHEHCGKLEELESILGLASETAANSFRLCAANERLAIEEKKLTGQSVNQMVVRYTAYENMLYKYSDLLFKSLIEQIGALRTLISQHKKEILQ